ARMIKPEQALQSYRWSSYPAYLLRAKARTKWLRCDRLFGDHGLGKETRRSRLEFSRRMEQLRLSADEVLAKELRRGWIYGAEDFMARLIDRFEKPVTEHHRSEERIQTDEELAERIVRAGMKELGWDEKELRRRRKGDQNKLRIATELRCSTSVNLRLPGDCRWAAGVTFQIYSELKQKVQKVRTDPYWTPRNQIGKISRARDRSCRAEMNRRSFLARGKRVQSCGRLCRGERPRICSHGQRRKNQAAIGNRTRSLHRHRRLLEVAHHRAKRA